MYDFNLKKETFSDTEDTQIKHFTTQTKEVTKSNQKAKTAKLIKVVKPRIIIKNLFTDLSNYKIIKEPKYILKIETKTATELRSVIGIKTLLDIISIILQNKRESNQEGSNKHIANATPPLVKQPQSQWQ